MESRYREQGVESVVKLKSEPLPSVNSFNYLGSVIYGSGGCGKDVDGRIKVAWSRWRDLSGVTYDKKVPMKLKSKLYKTVVRPAMVYESECWALRKQEEQRLHTTEIKMPRWSQGKTRKDRIKNETIRGIVRVTDAYQIGPDSKTTGMVWACDAKGRDPHNKKHVEHDGDGNPIQRTSKDEMA